MEPLVSILMPVYNQENYLAETLESVLTQSFRNFELILHDDGSTDKTAEIIKRYAATDERITARFGKNMGRCNALNLLVPLAKGKWCAICDADDLMLPNRLEKQVAFHQEHPQADASSCHCYYIDNSGRIIGKLCYPGLRTEDECRATVAQKEPIHCSITGLMITKSAYLEVGGMKQEFWYADDLEFINRFVDKGYLLLIIQEILMKYRVHPFAVTVQQPMKIHNMASYTYYCINCRRNGKTELSFSEFMAMRDKDPLWKRMDRRRYFYAQSFHKAAGFSLRSQRYTNFCWQILFASFLSPNFVFLTLIDKVRKPMRNAIS
jgi:glycosyltransferase involved in cell wall biosynthesis